MHENIKVILTTSGETVIGGLLAKVVGLVLAGLRVCHAVCTRRACAARHAMAEEICAHKIWTQSSKVHICIYRITIPLNIIFIIF